MLRMVLVMDDGKLVFKSGIISIRRKSCFTRLKSMKGFCRFWLSSKFHVPSGAPISPPWGEQEGALFHALDSFLVLDFLEAVSLVEAAGDELEGRVLTEVAELLAGRPAHVHVLDVLGGEVVASGGTLGHQFDVEVAQVAQTDALAVEHQVAQAADHLVDDGDDVALVVGAAVAGDVFGELVDVENLGALCGAVGLRLLNVLLLRSGLRAHNYDRIVNHIRPPPVLHEEGGVLYSAEGIAGVKVFLNLDYRQSSVLV